MTTHIYFSIFIEIQMKNTLIIMTKYWPYCHNWYQPQKKVNLKTIKKNYTMFIMKLLCKQKYFVWLPSLGKEISPYRYLPWCELGFHPFRFKRIKFLYLFVSQTVWKTNMNIINTLIKQHEKGVLRLLHSTVYTHIHKHRERESSQCLAFFFSRPIPLFLRLFSYIWWLASVPVLQHCCELGKR